MASAHGRKLKDYLDRVLPGQAAGRAGGLESMLSAPDPVESLAERNALPDAQRKTARSALEKVAADRDLDGDEQFILEAIIIPDQRPAVDIVNGDFEVVHPLWTKYNTDKILHRNLKKAIPSVGRIELPNHPSLPYGGTGSVVGKNLLMTNRHVAEIFASGFGTQHLIFKNGLTAGIDFKREKGDDGAGIILDIREVVMIHPYWDMALLRVEGLSGEHVPLLLSAAAPESLVDAEIAVIGYPAFDSRNDPAVQNKVFRGLFNVKRLQPGLILPRASVSSFGKSVSALCHDSSTLGGNSGSKVFDPKSGTVVALHFAGVYLDRNYCVPTGELARDSRVVDAGVNFEPGAKGGAHEWQAWWRKADGDESPASNAAAPTLAVAGEGGRWTVPIEITVRVGTGAAVSAGAAAGLGGASAGVEAMVEPTHDTDYATRKGYNAKFLGIAAPPPEPVQADSVVRLGGKTLIPYHHFSLALHKARRIALFTASNLDNSKAARRPEPDRKYDRDTLGGLTENDREKWFPDPRIDAALQLPDRFFNKDKGAFDKGHVVRREDVAWGQSFAEVQRANGDTFHVTNCSPQVKGFNQSQHGVDNWGDLENFVLKQAGVDKLSIFAGPVLAADDPVFVGVDDAGAVRIRIPRQYWKLVLAAEGGKLQSFAFVLRQDLGATPLEFVVDATWEKFMIPVADLEALNPLVKFAKAIRKADQAGASIGEAVREGLDITLTSKKRAARGGR